MAEASSVYTDVKKPLDISEMTKEEFDAELEKGYSDIKARKVIPAKLVREKMERQFRT